MRTKEQTFINDRSAHFIPISFRTWRYVYWIIRVRIDSEDKSWLFRIFCSFISLLAFTSRRWVIQYTPAKQNYARVQALMKFHELNRVRLVESYFSYTIYKCIPIWYLIYLLRFNWHFSNCSDGCKQKNGADRLFHVNGAKFVYICAQI